MVQVGIPTVHTELEVTEMIAIPRWRLPRWTYLGKKKSRETHHDGSYPDYPSCSWRIRVLQEPVISGQGQRSRSNPEEEYRCAVQLTRRMMGEHAWAQSRAQARSRPVFVYDKGDRTPQRIRRRRLLAPGQRACARHSVRRGNLYTTSLATGI